jgi:hypothetical protein
MGMVSLIDHMGMDKTVSPSRSFLLDGLQFNWQMADPAPEARPLVTLPFAVGIRWGFPFASRTKIRQVKTRHDRDRGKTTHDKTKQNKPIPCLVLSCLGLFIHKIDNLILQKKNTKPNLYPNPNPNPNPKPKHLPFGRVSAHVMNGQFCFPLQNRGSLVGIGVGVSVGVGVRFTFGVIVGSELRSDRQRGLGLGLGLRLGTGLGLELY